jgi:hypothetical protein
MNNKSVTFLCEQIRKRAISGRHRCLSSCGYKSLTDHRLNYDFIFYVLIKEQTI